MHGTARGSAGGDGFLTLSARAGSRLDAHGRRAALPTPTNVLAATPEKLLGHLNAVESANAPQVLYVIGRSELLREVSRVSIVGSRKASEDGLRRASRLARELAARGIAIVSGLAKGIDAAAHRGAIDAGGSTVAVIGTPLDQTYPREHAELQDLIARKHLLVSQFPLGYPVSRSNFPRRNRTMALLSHATVIAEAGDSSGTLSQGWEAIRLGRPLFIMQSVAADRGLAWPNEMIGYGAMVLQHTEEIMDVLPVAAPETLTGTGF